ncbi:LysR family transcriptional regulator [Photobacterium phosphoreum]|uniref:LysR family transcriptional regulator n=1 Tax=Photobacterium phosphoreum TaxID=659 RepID=UPI001E624338|nr:LysR family transcriptional regulator [Photobacterium phosphoreum]MCD9501179.1 LysR family transcriptional regulator [Photobacterium phosphoreum]
MIDLNEIKIFAAVVEMNSFVDAGKKLGMPSTTVSRKVQQLETALGVRLLNRSTRKLSLTNLGGIYYQQVKPFLYAMEEANQSLQQNQQIPDGLIRITAPFDFSVYYLQSVINDFLDSYPKVKIELIVNDNLLDMIDHNVDIAFRSGGLTTPTLIARKILRKQIIYCASKSYISHYGEPQSPSDLIDHNCILWQQSEAKQYWTFAYENGLKEFPVKGRFAADNTHLHITAVRAGRGIARLPEGLVEQYIDSGELIPILSEYSHESGNMYMVYPSHRLQPQTTRLFIDYVMDTFHGQ